MKFKSSFLMAVAMVFLASQLCSQSLIQKPKSSLQLTIQSEGGSNGTAVVYNPEKQLYYTVFAGNADYPLETYDISGNSLYTAQAGNDMRGMWWNPKKRALEGNCYLDGGIVSFNLDNLGYAQGWSSVIFDGDGHQPTEHSCGVIDLQSKEILYYNEGSVVGYSRKKGKPNGTYIELAIPVSTEDINWSSMIYTGVKNLEIGVLDQLSRKVYFFNRSGSLTGTVNLPAEAPVNEAFNFSYANGMIFLFDKDARVWTGYKIFES